MEKIYRAKVIHGSKIGQKLGFPTINLENPNLLEGEKEGVYAVKVKIKNTIYNGLLFYGPRVILGEKNKILEIYLFNFDKQIYGELITFQIASYIRPVKNFASSGKYKKQLAFDSQKAKQILVKANN